MNASTNKPPVGHGLADKGRSTLTMIVGALFSTIGAAGLVSMASAFFYLLTNAYTANDLISAIMWIIFFIAILVAGINLMVSGSRRKLFDLVPGFSLYFAGFSLIVNGFIYLLYANYLAMIPALLIGAALVLAEWRTKVI